jgi:hypothetical protein
VRHPATHAPGTPAMPASGRLAAAIASPEPASRPRMAGMPAGRPAAALRRRSAAAPRRAPSKGARLQAAGRQAAAAPAAGSSQRHSPAVLPGSGAASEPRLHLQLPPAPPGCRHCRLNACNPNSVSHCRRAAAQHRRCPRLRPPPHHAGPPSAAVLHPCISREMTTAPGVATGRERRPGEPASPTPTTPLCVWERMLALTACNLPNSVSQPWPSDSSSW